MQQGKQWWCQIYQDPEYDILNDYRNHIVFGPAYTKINPKVESAAAVKFAEHIQDDGNCQQLENLTQEQPFRQSFRITGINAYDKSKAQ
jgi:hypothetical protein